MRTFRLSTLFWVVAVVAAALAASGDATGLFIACAVVGFWAYVFTRRGVDELARALLDGEVVIFLLFFLLILPGMWRPGPNYGHRLGWSLHNMKLLGMALHNYHEAKGEFPPPYRAGTDGRPILSWRVLILPFAEEKTLYDSLDLSKPWDDVRNRACDTTCPTLFCSQLHAATTTEFLAVVGPQAAWRESRSTRLRNFSDGAEQTILLIEAPAEKVHWAEPRDLTFAQAVDLLCKPATREDGHHRMDHGYFYKRSSGRCALFADGHVRYLRTPLDRRLAAALLTPDGGEKISAAALDRISQPELDYANCYVVSLFMFLVLLPTLRVVLPRKMRSAT